MDTRLRLIGWVLLLQYRRGAADAAAAGGDGGGVAAATLAASVVVAAAVRGAGRDDSCVVRLGRAHGIKGEDSVPSRGDSGSGYGGDYGTGGGRGGGIRRRSGRCTLSPYMSTEL